MRIAKRIRFREEEKKEEISLKDIAREIKPRTRRMLGFAGNALVRRRK